MKRRLPRAAAIAWSLAALAGACAAPGAAPLPVAGPRDALARAESAYADLRALRDSLEVGLAAGRHGAPLVELAARHDSLREALERRLAPIDSSTLPAEDGRALAIMRRALDEGLAPIGAAMASTGPSPSAPACRFDARAVGAAPGGADSLRRLTYACYGWAQSHVSVSGRTVDRLSVLAALARTDDPVERRKLFLALAPVWASMNGNGGPDSPYRVLLSLAPRGAESPAGSRARALGIEPDSLEDWLLEILSTWRAATPDSELEPWDWHYAMGRAGRMLDRRIPLERLYSLDVQVFQAIGADPVRLDVHFDLEPRDGKTPVAFTTFGRRARRLGGAWVPAQPWVFATYREGGLGNLNELLHETGHAVHIAAIHTRPAFLDWPDSDPFSEALADFVALDVYEPAWQLRWLGDSVPLADGLRARYAGVVLDVAWALLEARLERDPAADPNRVWTDITGTYLRIRPHPELSWWAMRGQLLDSPGYMMNYAAGAILIAAIRARTRELHGSFAAGDPTWYGWVAPRLFRFGLERTSRDVIVDFLGGPLTPAAILGDMRRMKP